MASNKTSTNANIPMSFIEMKSPTLGLSILFTILFGTTVILHFYRTLLKTKRRQLACIYLFSFTLTRTLGFIFRCAWAKNEKSKGLAIVSNIFLTGGFFLVCQSLYMLFLDLITPLSRFLREKKLFLIKHLFPIFSIIGIIDAVKSYESESGKAFNIGRDFAKVSAIGFTTLIGFLLIMTTFYAIKYREKISCNGQTRLIAVLYFATSLLLLEMVYKVMSNFSTSTDSVNREQWVFYGFEAVPELVLLIFLGAVNVGHLFYSSEKDSTINNNENDSTYIDTSSDTQIVTEISENKNWKNVSKLV
ncbi:416_t:CDS:1 [Ambispora gerdemannii]|uniref:416_t:CDS:1 n=1 Tax=Ambispora gerdemannii TaxID=144530 RepID=A0A9N8ZFS2_9GLOM|nr:416_t:CDS:1 [Ambispora gerdemannii]